MKLHLPVRLFRYVFSCFSLAAVFSLSSGSVTAADTFVLNSESVLSIDYADVSSIFDLSGGILQLSGDTLLNLSNCGVGDGKTYTLLTGVSALRDAEGNAIVLDSSNNAISHYFDTTRPGTGFWADATLALTDDGTLQLVRHHETVKAAQTITTRQTESLVYSYYAGISFEDITQASSSSSVFGGAIYGSRDSTITLSGNGSVTFSGNTASASSSSSSYSYAYGGAIYGRSHSTIELSGNGSVTFSGNTASSGGGAIYGAAYSTITLSGNGSVEFSGNSASDDGGAIGGSTIELSGNGSVTFSGNSAGYGGAIRGSSDSTITLNDNGSVTFSGNSASDYGGAIDGNTIVLNGNGSVEFSGNSASDYGGAIYGGSNSTIELSGNESVTFSGNTASASSSSIPSSGGAIYGGENSTIRLSGNGSVTFSGNTVSGSYAYGGAIYGDVSTIELNGNGSVVFSGNTARSSGGAIDGDDDSTIELSGNGSVTFSENTAMYGGAINSGWCEIGGAITLSGNVSVTFSGNTSLYGGAIDAGSDSTITLSGNESVTFSGNTASSSNFSGGGIIYSGGGAIAAGSDSTITLSGNGSVTFSENTASSDSYAYGGAIDGNSDSTITLSDNVSVTFSGNTARLGGAIYGGTCSTITLNDNESVTFSENTASYTDSTAYGGAICGSTITLNDNGSVTFSGNTVSATDSYAYGGAIYGSRDSTITLNDNGSVTFSENTASSGGAIGGWDGSTITLNDNGSVVFSGNTASSYGGAIDGDEDSTIELSGNGSVVFSGNTASSYGGAIDGWDGSTITLNDNGSVTFSGNTASSYGGAIYGRDGSTIELSGNGSVEFNGNMARLGGAIDGSSDSTITLNDNESVTFSGNTASSTDSNAYGGAIGGYANSTIELNGNGSVTFSENSASSSSNAFGGAIYGGSSSTITLSGNESVEFSGNTASSSTSSAYGGAIYGGKSSAITLSENDSVNFRGNTAENEGGAVYIHETASLMLEGNVEISFIENSASLGGAIYGDTSSTIMLSENDSVNFRGNTAENEGGAVYIHETASLMLEGNVEISFIENSASLGGAIYGDTSSTITLSENDSVNFRGNTAENEGGAVYIHETASLMLEGNGEISFIENSASLGSAIYGDTSSTITLSENDSVNFRGNTAENEGGAVYIHETASLMLEGNVEISFIENSASDGGAIYGEWNSTITLSDNGSVTFSGNTASSSGYNDRTYGGAIHGGTIEMNGNGSVTFSGNSVSGSYAYGGAIYGYGSTIELSGNGSVTFSGNTADDSGGAIYGYANSTIALSNNGSVEFSGNSVSGFASGGAICGRAITLNDNGSVMFNGNAAHCGGAIYGGPIELNRNGRVTFSENSASSSANAFGGAIHGGSSSPITLNENDNVTFNGNSASSSANAYGGAIDGSSIELSGNGSVTFSGNKASSSGYNARAYGGAIHTSGNLSIRNNDSVLFEKNAEISDSSYRLRSIYAGGSGAVISLSAAEGNSIEFRDSVYIDSGSTVELNADYTDAAGVVHKQTGDIIFTGKYTEQHLNELLSAAGEERTATESEILDSRTSVVSSVINLYGGRLRVEDGAVLDCAGLNVAGGESRVSGTGSLVLGGGLSVADGADVILEVATSAAGVTVGDDASLSLRGNFSLTPGAEDSAGSKLITVGRNAELSLTDSSLLGQVALADETSGLYYQNTNGAKLLQFSGDWGTGGLNLTTEAVGYTVTVSGGTNFAGDITVLDGAVFDFRGNNTTLDATAKISLDSGSTLKLSGSDYAVMSDVLKRATGAGNARLESEAYLSHEDKIQLTGDLIVGSGGRLYLGELPNNVHGGDLYTDNGTAPAAPCTGTLVLDGGSLTFRGSRMELGRVDVTANSSLEIWDQAGSNQKANEYCSIAELNVNASLQLATTWKSKLDIDVLQGSGAVTVGSSKEYREVRVHDLSGYTGVLSAAGSKTTLELNLVSHSVLNADSVQLSNGATATLSGSGTYHLATAKTLADGVSLAEDWSGVVRLSGATLVNDTLSGLSNANSAVELNGVSGYLSRADARTGAQTYDVNLKLTDNESAAAWNLNNGYNGDKRIFTGEITGTGTLERSSYRGTHQTLVFTGDTSGWTGAINHLPDSATSSGAPISTNVTFSGTQVLNVSTSTNGKGELNVTLDDEHLQAGSKVSVNGAIGANRLTVTEGTTVSLNNEVNVNTLRTAGTAELSADASVRLGGITLSADNPVSALISGVESTGSTMRGLRADAVVKNVSIISTVSAYTVSSMTLQGVQFATETEQTALTLSGVVFDGTCSFSVGETGQILLDKAILTVLVGTPAGGGNGVLALDYSDLFHCTASGELEITMDEDVEQLLAAGYHTITLDLGDDVNYDNLNLTLNGTTYAGNSQGVAQFSLRAVPEPTSATLSLLALAALAARRRRK